MARFEPDDTEVLLPVDLLHAVIEAVETCDTAVFKRIF